MFATAKGCLGLGPEGMANEDRVCSFLGGNVPFVVSGLGDLGGGDDDGDVMGRRLRMFGETYVHGVMGGEIGNGRQMGRRAWAVSMREVGRISLLLKVRILIPKLEIANRTLISTCLSSRRNFPTIHMSLSSISVATCALREP